MSATILSPADAAGALTVPAAADPNARLTRGATLTYSLALAFIALLSVSVHFLLDSVIAQQRDSATLINVAGRQRMLSQRIALLASDLRAGDETARAPLLEAAALMQRSHDAIGRGDDLGISNALSPDARAYFERGTDALDVIVPAYLTAARLIVEDPAGVASDDAYEMLHTSARTTLLPKLNGAVTIFEREATERLSWLRTVQAIVLGILLVTLVLEALFIFRPLVERIRRHASKLTELASRDYLTGLWNRRSFFEAADRELGLARRTQKPISVVVLDLDHFKSVNDTHGHAVGDAVLQHFAHVASATLRRTDILGRIGGEEFALIAPDADGAAALVVAEKLRSAIEADNPTGTPRVTVSIGVAEVAADDGNISSAVERADAALYDAKRGGRNRVVVAGHHQSVGPLRTTHPR